jgi:transcriptional regulator with XRE-family HTH domain
MSAFGIKIAQARKSKLLSQKELAGRIQKEDGQPISTQYLNDIERGRRNAPSEFLIAQFARELSLDRDHLCLVAGVVPQDLWEPISEAAPKKVSEALRMFRRAIVKR